jgi:DNA invertase Pin-like site-specific DNA recombinase
MAEIPVLRVNDAGEHLEPPPAAYSYVRFSTSAQHLGDSLRRQVDAAEKYCKEHGLALNPVSYRDLGVSAFKRKNLEKGALAAFISAVKQGIIPKGSFLIIEQFDRLSRADIDLALELLLHLVRSGIKVVTLSDGKVWDKEAVKDVGNLIIAIVFMSRANNESAAKSERLEQVWDQKKLKAGQPGQRIVTSECPRWLKANEEKTGFIVLEDRVESVKKVFAMRIGGYGASSIASRANEERWPRPGNGRGDGWHTSTVGRLLKNRALLGEYQPHKNGDGETKRMPVGEPVLGYYPVVLDETMFLRAQASADRKGAFPGRRDASLKNWLQGLLKCECGRSMVRKNKNSQAQPGYARYYCTGRNRKVKRADGTLCPGASALELETAVLEVVSVNAPQYFEGTARSEALKAKADLLGVDLATAKLARDRYEEAIGSSKAPVASLVVRLTDAEAKVADIEKELRAVRAELADLAGDFETVFENIRKAVASVDSLDARAALREDLSRIIEKVVVHQDEGFIQVHLRGETAPVGQRLREDAGLPEQTALHEPASAFVPGLPQGIAVKLLTRAEQAAYLAQTEKDEESETGKGA